MPAYKIASEKKISRQAGDDFDIVMHVPALFPLEPTDFFEFFISNSHGAAFFQKTTIQDGQPPVGYYITINGQVITIPFWFGDTPTESIGSYKWKLTHVRNQIHTRLGQGIFELT